MVGLASQRGTDPARERRRLRESESDEKDAIGRLLEAILWVSGEAFFFGLATLAWTTLYGDVTVTFVVTVALSALCLGGGVVRAWRTDDEQNSRGWPPMTARLVAFRLVYYNVALAGAVAIGLALVSESFISESVVRVEWATDPLVGPVAVAALFTGLAGWLLPRVVSLVEG